MSELTDYQLSVQTEIQKCINYGHNQKLRDIFLQDKKVCRELGLDPFKDNVARVTLCHGMNSVRHWVQLKRVGWEVPDEFICQQAFKPGAIMYTLRVADREPNTISMPVALSNPHIEKYYGNARFTKFNQFFERRPRIRDMYEMRVVNQS